jgi:membrane associated rhomboid family serine protease
MTPWVTRLLIANVVVFVLQETAMPQLTRLFAFHPGAMLARPWTVVTYMFLHGGMTHLLFNMLTLYFFGPQVEGRLGERRFVTLYFLSGIAGALFTFLSPSWIVGASGAIFGVSLAFAMFWPRAQILIWGILPVEARVLVVIMTMASIYFGLRGGGNVAHFAHLGGYAGAFLYLRWLQYRAPHAQFKRRVETLRPASAAPDVERWSRISRDGLHELNLEELDRLRAKIAADGPRALTPDERAFLDRLSLRSGG